MVLTSAKYRNDEPLSLAFALNFAFMILGLFAGQERSFNSGRWQPVDLQLLGIVAAVVAVILIGSVGAAIAYQNGPPTTVSPGAPHPIRHMRAAVQPNRINYDCEE